MNRRFATAVALWAGVGLAACSRDEPKRPETAKALIMTPGEDLSAKALEILRSKCVACHGAERFSARHFTPEEWSAVIERMVGRGAALSAEEREVLRNWPNPK